MPEASIRPLRDLYALWDSFSNVPTRSGGDQDGAIDNAFMYFPAGTHREVVWQWFESQNSRFIVGDVLQGVRLKEDGTPSTRFQQEQWLSRDAIQMLLRDRYDASVRRDSIGYYESVAELAEKTGTP